LVYPATGDFDTTFEVSFNAWDDSEENYPLKYTVLIIPEEATLAAIPIMSSQSNIFELKFPTSVSTAAYKEITIQGHVEDEHGAKTVTDKQVI